MEAARVLWLERDFEKRMIRCGHCLFGRGKELRDSRRSNMRYMTIPYGLSYRAQRGHQLMSLSTVLYLRSSMSKQKSLIRDQYR